MKTNMKLRKIFAVITDMFIFSIFVRVILYSCLQLGMKTESSFFLSLLLGGSINYVLVPLYLRGQTVGMKMNGLVYSFVKKNTTQHVIVLAVRFLSQLLLNVVFLGIPLAVNLFFLIWRKDGVSIADQLFSRMMVNQKVK